jgi:hypothetical protein
MVPCPETPIVMLLWLASLVFCFYGKAWVDDREEVKSTGRNINRCPKS